MLNKIVKLISIVSSIYMASANSKAVAMDNNIESFFYNKASEISKLKKDAVNIELFVNQGYAQITDIAIGDLKTNASRLLARQNGVAVCLFLVFKKIYNLNEAELKIAISSIYADYKNIDNYSILYKENYRTESGNNSLNFNCIINLDAIDSILINDLQKDSLSIKKILPQQINLQKPDVKKNTTKGMSKIQSLKGLRLVLGIYQVGELERVESVLKELQIDYAFAGYAKDNYFTKLAELLFNQQSKEPSAENANLNMIDIGAVKIKNTLPFTYESDVDLKYSINIIKTSGSASNQTGFKPSLNDMQNSIKYAILYIKDKRNIEELNALLEPKNLSIKIGNEINMIVIN
jgi:hypothetical protein